MTDQDISTTGTTDITGTGAIGMSTGGTGDDSGVGADVRNAYIMAKIRVHPFTTFDEVYFMDLLENSLSLNVFEKKRVVDAVPTLSQFQIDELTKVFEDEREEFRKLLPTEGETIREYVVKARREWIQLYEIYQQEIRLTSQSSDDQSKIDDLKKSLGL